MSIQYHPLQRSIVTVDFDQGFKVPEMVKRRLAVVLSPAIEARAGICTVVPLSTTAPTKIMPYHCTYKVPFQMPKQWGNIERWIKGDMVCSIGFHRIDLLRLDKDRDGKRRYQLEQINEDDFKKIRKCVLHGLGLSKLTKGL